MAGIAMTGFGRSAAKIAQHIQPDGGGQVRRRAAPFDPLAQGAQARAFPCGDFVKRIPEFRFETQTRAPPGELDIAHLWPAPRQFECHEIMFFDLMKPHKLNLQPSDGSTKRILVMVVGRPPLFLVIERAA